jgi:hypothetical protein
MKHRKRARNCVVSVAQWAEHAGLADDGRSIAAARQVLALGDGPLPTKIGNRDGVDLGDHAKWARSKPWAKYLSERAAAERDKQHGKHHRRRN